MKMKAVLALLILAGASQPLCAQTTFARKGPAEPTGKIEVFNTAGTVTVSAWDRPDFSVEASLDPGVDRVDVTSDKGVNTIRVLLKSRVLRPWNDQVNAHLNVHIPAGSYVEIHTTSAATSVQGINGPLWLHSVSGSIRASGFGKVINVRAVSGRVDIQGSGSVSDVHVETVSGAISIRDAAGKFDVETTSGRVDLALLKVTEARVQAVSGSVSIARQLVSDVSGRFDIRTTSGRVDLALGKVADARVRTISGSTSIAGELGADTHIDSSAVSGSVRINVLGGQGFRYDLSSHSGSLHTCFDGGVSGQKQLMGQRQGGAADVRVRTVSGAVELCDR
jgi:DUF4097 and DUF4098 domain-containing protein YvlB